MEDQIEMQTMSNVNETSEVLGASAGDANRDNIYPKRTLFVGDTSPSKVSRAAEALRYLHPRANHGEIRNDRYVPNERTNEVINNDRFTRNVTDSLIDLQAKVAEMQQGSGANLRRPKVMPDSYDGKGSWSQYMAHFETVADLNGWSERDKSLYLSVSLRGEACQVIQLLSPVQRRDYNALLNAMNRRFDPGNNASLYRVQLRTRSRKDRETLPQLAQSIRTLATNAYPTADHRLFDSLCCDHFIDALQDDDLKMRLLHADCDRFDDLVAHAIKFEACVKARQLKQNKRYVREVTFADEVSNEVSEFNANAYSQDCNAVMTGKSGIDAKELQKLQEQLQALTKLVADMCSAKQGNLTPRPITCFGCGKSGHKRPDCPDKPFGNSRGTNSKTPQSN